MKGGWGPHATPKGATHGMRLSLGSVERASRCRRAAAASSPSCPLLWCLARYQLLSCTGREQMGGRSWGVSALAPLKYTPCLLAPLSPHRPPRWSPCHPFERPAHQAWGESSHTWSYIESQGPSAAGKESEAGGCQGPTTGTSRNWEGQKDLRESWVC